MRICFACGKTGNHQKHHVLHGHGKRRTFETKESLVDICYECHKKLHGEEGSELDRSLKLKLQKQYVEMGHPEWKVRELMGGKLI